MSWPVVDPGKMVHQIQILRQAPGKDVSGTRVDFSPFITTWAQMEPVKGTDMLRSGQDITQLYITVTIRWQDGIQPNMKVQAQNGTYIIRSIENPGERNVILVLNCLALGLNQ
jgi:head-tail adaptor